MVLYADACLRPGNARRRPRWHLQIRSRSCARAESEKKVPNHNKNRLIRHRIESDRMGGNLTLSMIDNLIRRPQLDPKPNFGCVNEKRKR